MNKEKRLMMSEEEVRQRAKELLNLPKEHLIAQYMFLEQDVQKYKEVIDKAIKILDNYQNNLYSKSARELLDDDIEKTIITLKEVE